MARSTRSGSARGGGPADAPRPAARRTPVMKPRFTIGIVYLFGFFFVYALALVAPALWEVLHSMEPGPEMEQRAYEVARETAGPRLRYALIAAVATTGLGVMKGWLPGTSE